MAAIHLHDTLTRLRKAHGFTQEEAAGRLGVSNQAVSKWETGACCPDVALLPDIAALYDVSLDELFGREKERAADEHAQWQKLLRMYYDNWVNHFIQRHDYFILKFHVNMETLLDPGNPLHSAFQQALRALEAEVPADAPTAEKTRRIHALTPLLQRVLAE